MLKPNQVRKNVAVLDQITQMSLKTTDPRAVHAQTIKSLPDRSDINNLIVLYSKSNLVSAAVRLFNTIPSPNVVSWTVLISALSGTHSSLHKFISMLRHPTLPNQRTLASLFKTCASLPSLSFGLQLHSLSLKLCLSSQPFAASALVHFYSKTCKPVDARKVFDEITESDQVCFSSIVVGLAQNSRPCEALSYFAAMRASDLGSTMYSVSAALRAAAELAALEQSRVIHGHAVVTGLDSNLIVGTALIDGYGKCGLVINARQVFDEMPELNIIGWNALMAAYAQQGDNHSVMELFQILESQGFSPDGYTFLAVLTSFCLGGLADETEFWFNKMKSRYKLEPWLEHYTCLISVKGRTAQLEEAEKIALTMPYKPDAAVWRALLSNCAHHGAADMARRMSNRLLELNPRDDSAYIIASNIYASTKRWDEVTQVRKLMKERRVKKESGMSWIEVRGEVCVFFAGDRSHDRTDEIYSKLGELMEEITKMGYKPVLDEMLHEVEKSEKMESLWYHSEKLALAYAVVSGAAPPGKALRIVKNLRICKDCHEAFKYFGRVLEREIIVRDNYRYHRFLNGKCTCGDFW